MYHKIVIFSEKLELYYFMIKCFGAENEIVRYEYGSFPEKEELGSLLEKSDGVMMDADSNFKESLKLVRRIRICGFTGFILFISRTEDRQEQVGEKVSAINAGADEYLCYPQTNEEIAASVKALLRRFYGTGTGVLEIGGKPFQISLKERKVYMDGVELPLTKTEFDIVNYLVIHRNRAVSYKELYDAVWEKEYLHDDMNIRAHIHRIRKKMGDDARKPRYIQNVHGIGYIIEGK